MEYCNNPYIVFTIMVAIAMVIYTIMHIYKAIFELVYI
jgi:hypothetical protein